METETREKDDGDRGEGGEGVTGHSILFSNIDLDLTPYVTPDVNQAV